MKAFAFILVAFTSIAFAGSSYNPQSIQSATSTVSGNGNLGIGVTVTNGTMTVSGTIPTNTDQLSNGAGYQTVTGTVSALSSGSNTVTADQAAATGSVAATAIQPSVLNTRLSSNDSGLLLSTSTNGLFAWYTAGDVSGTEGNTVTSWPDRSGNGRTLTPWNGSSQTMATTGFLGNPAVRFNGSGCMASATLSNLVVTGFTTMTIGWQQAGTSNYGTMITSFGSYPGNAVTETWDNHNPLPPPNYTQPDSSYCDWLGTYVGQSYTIRFRPHITVALWDGSSHRAAYWYDNFPIFSDNNTIGGVSSGTINGPLCVGGRTFAGDARPLTGLVSQYIVWTRALSDIEVQQLSQKFSAAYRIDAAPRIVFIGDSIACGYDATYGNQPSELLAPRFPSHRVVNNALGGTQTTDWLNNRTRTYSALRPGDTVLLWCGFNDLKLGSSTANAVNTNLTAIVGKIHNAGARAIVGTVLPGYYSATGTTQSDYTSRATSINAYITSGSTGADVVFDPTMIPQFSYTTGTAYTNGTYYYDAPSGIHPTTAGYQLMLPRLVYAAKKALGQTAALTLSGTLTSGSCVIADTAISGSDNVIVQPRTVGANSGLLTYTQTTGTISIVSSNASDASVVSVTLQ